MKSQLMISVEASQYALIGVFDSQSNITSIPRKPERIPTRPSPKTQANLRDQLTTTSQHEKLNRTLDLI